jgi:Spy/CpxP family protein refolding chaperone
MVRRRLVIGSAVVVGLGLLGTVTAWALGPHGPGRHGMMRRAVVAMIDDALDQAQVTPEQRVRIHTARDGAFAAVDAHMASRRGTLDEALALFETDQVDRARLDAFRAQREAEHRQVADAVTAALVEIHDTLAPAQRKVVADWVREHRRWHGHGAPAERSSRANPLGESRRQMATAPGPESERP